MAHHPHAGSRGEKPIKDDPGTGRAEHSLARSFYLHPDGHFIRDLQPAALADVVRRGDGQLWVDVDSSDHCQQALLEKVFQFHPLSIEDTLSPNGRVKVEQFDSYLFVVMRAVTFKKETADPYDIETINLYLFIGHNFLVTVHAGLSGSVDEAAGLVERNNDLLARGTARLSHLIMDTAVDDYFPVLDQIDTFIDGLEQRIFESFDQSALQDIFQVKRLVLLLRRHLMPQREIFNSLANRPTPFLSPDVQPYFRDVYDHMLRINDSLETYRELLSSTMDSYLTQVSNRLGMVTKGLSVVATLSIPFVVISGMYGMNVKDIPLADHPHAFMSLVYIQLGIGLLLVAILRWRKLI
jgi:magnesium transporter